MKNILIAGLLGIHTCLFGQILNTDAFETGVDTTRALHLKWDLGFNLIKQQTLLLAFDTELNTAWATPRNMLMLIGHFNFFRTGKQNLLNGGYGHLRWRYLGHRRLQPEVFAQYQMDAVRGMLHRGLAGSNLRMHLWESPQGKGRFDLGLGAMYEYEHWNYSGVPAGTPIPPNAEPIKNHFIKFNSYLAYNQKVKEFFAIQAMIYFQARPDSYFRYPRLSGDLSFQFKLSKHIALAVEWKLLYDALPPVPVTKMLYTVMNKLSFHF